MRPQSAEGNIDPKKPLRDVLNRSGARDPGDIKIEHPSHISAPKFENDPGNIAVEHPLQVSTPSIESEPSSSAVSENEVGSSIAEQLLMGKIAEAVKSDQLDVKIRRSTGEIEEGWIIVQGDEKSGTVTVINEKTNTKEILPLKELLEINEDLLDSYPTLRAEILQKGNSGQEDSLIAPENTGSSATIQTRGDKEGSGTSKDKTVGERWNEIRAEYKAYKKDVEIAQQEYLRAAEEYENKRHNAGFMKRWMTTSAFEEEKKRMIDAEKKYDELLDGLRNKRQERLQAKKVLLGSGDEGATKVVARHEALLERFIDNEVQLVEALRYNENEQGESRNKYLRNLKKSWNWYRTLPLAKRLAVSAAVGGVVGAFAGATGLVTGGAVVVGATVAARRAVGGLFGSVVALETKRLGDSLVEKYEKKKLKEQQQSFKEKELSESRKDRLSLKREVRWQKRGATVAAAGAAIAAGASASSAVNSVVDVLGEATPHVQPVASSQIEGVRGSPEVGTVGQGVFEPPKSGIEQPLETPKPASSVGEIPETPVQESYGTIDDALNDKETAALYQEAPKSPEPQVNPAAGVIGRNIFEQQGLGIKPPLKTFEPIGQVGKIVETPVQESYGTIDDALNDKEIADLYKELVVDEPKELKMEGVYEAGSSVERELQQFLSDNAWVKEQYPDLTDTERGAIAHRLRLQLEEHPDMAEKLKIQKGNWNTVLRDEKYSFYIEKDLVEQEINSVHARATHGVADTPSGKVGASTEASSQSTPVTTPPTEQPPEAPVKDIPPQKITPITEPSTTSVISEGESPAPASVPAEEVSSEVPQTRSLVPEDEVSVEEQPTKPGVQVTEKSPTTEEPYQIPQSRSVAEEILQKLRNEQDEVATSAEKPSAQVSVPSEEVSPEVPPQSSIPEGEVTVEAPAEASKPSVSTPPTEQPPEAPVKDVPPQRITPLTEPPKMPPVYEDVRVEDHPVVEPQKTLEEDFQETKEVFRSKGLDYQGNLTSSHLVEFFANGTFDEMLRGQKHFVLSNWGPISHAKLDDILDGKGSLTFAIGDEAPVTMGAQAEQLCRSVLAQLEKGVGKKIPNIHEIIEEGRKQNITLGELVKELSEKIKAQEVPKIEEAMPEKVVSTHPEVSIPQKALPIDEYVKPELTRLGTELGLGGAQASYRATLPFTEITQDIKDTIERLYPSNHANWSTGDAKSLYYAAKDPDFTGAVNTRLNDIAIELRGNTSDIPLAGITVDWSAFGGLTPKEVLEQLEQQIDLLRKANLEERIFDSRTSFNVQK